MLTKTPYTIKQIVSSFAFVSSLEPLTSSLIVPEQKLFNNKLKFTTYLGRPWKKFSTTIIMESTLGDFIKLEGWMHFKDLKKSLYHVEYNNRGPSANLNARVN
ncbi:hypothetical protein Golax_018795 [Gossypium laxum]|uniref:Pectinesterase catalytic domain-containing protein n=1 Tax=Gossypium laxum TaxID=34288 RepID=A0A7J8Z4G8_9ROSI|nr:hypothetical protein [Gossypium laxum]